jgi:hypothetical protein
MKREEKITLGEMRASGPQRLLVCCGDYKCAHSVTISSGRWPDHVRLSDLEPLFVCQFCGHRGDDVRPLFEPAQFQQKTAFNVERQSESADADRARL